jgi:hypothetical protein
MPWRESAPLLGKSAQVYVLSFGILKGIDGRAELPTIKFNIHLSLLDMHLYLRYRFYDRQFFSLHLIFVSCLESL